MRVQATTEFLLLLAAAVILVLTVGGTLIGALSSLSQNIETSPAQTVDYTPLQNYTVDIIYDVNPTLLFTFLYVIVESPSVVYGNTLPLTFNSTVTILSDAPEVNYLILVNDTVIDEGVTPPTTFTLPITVNEFGEYNICAVARLGDKNVGSCSVTNVVNTSVPGWKYRRLVLIYSQAGGNNVVLYFTLDTQTLISQGKMRSDCADIRIYDYTFNQLPHWVLPGTCNTSNTVIFFRGSASPGTTTFYYLYYGNGRATNVENPYGVFDVFEDFTDGTLDGFTIDLNESGITEVGEGYARYSIANGKLNMEFMVYRSADTYDVRTPYGRTITYTYPTWRYYQLTPRISPSNPLVVYRATFSTRSTQYYYYWVCYGYGYSWNYKYAHTVHVGKRDFAQRGKLTTYGGCEFDVKGWYTYSNEWYIRVVDAIYPPAILNYTFSSIDYGGTSFYMGKREIPIYTTEPYCRFGVNTDYGPHALTYNREDLRFGVTMRSQWVGTASYYSGCTQYQTNAYASISLDFIGIGPGTDVLSSLGPEEQLV